MKTKNIIYLSILLTFILLGACVKEIEVFTGNIVGKITDAKTGEPLQGVSITISPTGNTKTTGSDGIYEFPDLEPKQYEIQASKNGYSSNSKRVTVVTGHDASGDMQLTPIIEEGVLALSVSTLDFGSNNSSLPFNILNNGNKRINWSISELKDVDWLSISPSSGTIEAGKSNAVVVTLDRNRIKEHKETVIIINADKESLPLKIIAEAEKKSSKIELNTKSLNFGSEYNTLSFDIKNIGNAGNVNWDITGIDVDWIKVDPMSGTTAMDKSSAVKVQVDRSKLGAGEHNTTIFVNADGESSSLRITAQGVEKVSKIELSTDSLNFGTENSVLTFEIKNTGNAGDADWEITGIDVDWIKVDPMSGTTAMGKSSAVKVEVDRSKLKAEKNTTTIIVKANGESLPLKISAEAEKKVHKIELSTNELDFGIENNVLTFDIKNTGNAGDANWEITGIDVDWVKAEPMSGTTAMGKSSAVKVEVDRSKLKAEKNTTTIIVKANGESLPLKISAEAEKKVHKIELSTNELDFGIENNVLTFDIKNTGNAGDANWEITGIDVDWVKAEPMSGTTAMGKSSAVKVEVDRSKLEPGKHNATILVNANGESLPLKITAEVEERFHKIELDTDVLDFGAENNILNFEIKNTGNAGSTNWKIEGIEADWVKINPLSGTTAMGKSSTIKVEIDRSKLEFGTHSTTFTVATENETFSITIYAEKVDDRYLVISPEELDLGTEDSKDFQIYSYNGSTTYQMEIRGNGNWAQISSTEGVLPEYVPGDTKSIKTFTVSAIRSGLTPGEYNFTLVIKTEVGDYELPISMTVEESYTPGDEEIISCNDNLKFTLTSCTITGTTATLSYMVENTGNTPITLNLYGSAAGYSYIFDDQGNEYDFGYNKASLTLGTAEGYNSACTTIPAGVKVKGTVKIHNVDDYASKFANITIWSYNDDSYLIFKNVAIQGRSYHELEEPQTTGAVASCNENLEFTLTSCKISGNTATLSYMVENTGNTPITLNLYGSAAGYSYIFDDQGNEYDFGYNKASLTLGTAEGYNSACTTIPAGVKVKGTVKIHNVDDYASKFANITIWSYNDDSYLIFKNVAIQGRSYHELEEPQTTGAVASCNENLEFTLTSCKISGSTATLSYMVENTRNAPITLNLYGSAAGYSYIYDDQGNKYDFGYNKASLTLGTAEGYNSACTTIPAGVKVKGTVKIHNVDDYASKFANITIWSYNDDSYLIFKNVAIQGRSYHSVEEPQTTGTVISCSDDLEFTLLDCKRNSSNTVTITYRVANVTNKAVYLNLYGQSGGYSYIYDDLGNQYDFGYNKASLTLGTTEGYNNVSTTIPGNVFAKGSIVVKNVDESATELSNVNIWSYSHQANLVFKNVKIRK